MSEADVQRSISAANAAGIFAEGSRFGAYVLGPCIGHGESGRIYRAEHEAINTPLALKVFTDELARSTMGRSRFLREARHAATIREAAHADPSKAFTNPRFEQEVEWMIRFARYRTRQVEEAAR